MLLSHALRAAGVPTFKYINKYTSSTAVTNFSFSGVSFGNQNYKRLVIVGVAGRTANCTSMTIGGISATRFTSVTTTNCRTDIYAASVPMGLTGTVSGVLNAAVGIDIFVWAGYPDSTTQVDALTASAGSGNITLTDLAKTAGGFAVFVGFNNTSGGTSSLTETGVETITENYDGPSYAGANASAYSFIVTQTTTTDDYTFSGSGSNNRSISGVTWA